MAWVSVLERTLGLLLTGLICARMRDGYWGIVDVAHLLLSTSLGLQAWGPRLSSLVAAELGLAAFLFDVSDPYPPFAALWRLVPGALLLLAMLGCCFSKTKRKLKRRQKQKNCVGSFCVVVLAVIVHFIVLFRPAFTAEDILGHVGPPTFLETPSVRAEYCAKASSARQPPGLDYMCDGIEPLSWEDAEAKAEKTLAQLTMEERHSLMQGIGWQAMPPGLPLPLPALPKRGYYMGNAPPIPRLGVPALKLHDAGNGFRNNPPPVGKPFTTVMWPSSLAFGATWDPALVERVARAIGKEYRGKGANLILGPSVQVQRVTRNGRNFEYMSGEDPYLGARLTEAYVRGVQREGVIACLKHYGFNEQETQRNGGNFIVDERTAWELYYPPFEAGVAAGAASVMCSYNRINGTYACASEGLLARDLKKKMGFRGFVMSDWWALHDQPEFAVFSGFDQEMPGAGADTRFYPRVLRAFEESKVAHFSEELGLPRERMYKDAAFRILSAIWKMRLDERPGCTPGKDCVEAIESDQVSEENSELARVTATESVVLLKNSGVLPLDPKRVRTLALVGQALNATSLATAEIGMLGDYYSGGGSGHCYVDKASLRTPLMGFRERAERLGMRVLASPSNDVVQALDVSKSADVTVVLLATTAEESQDRASLALDHGADTLVESLSGPRRGLVVLTQVPGAVFMPWRDSVEAIALQFLGGEKTSHAWEAVVFGDVAPSGKLPIQLPKDRRGVIEPGVDTDNYYTEGLFSSYRARNANEVAAFPFGHGLSYTEFTYSEPVQLPASACKAHACVKITVTNSGGERAGAEVAQAYVEFPPEAQEPKLVLKGFHRTAVLQPGGGEEVVFTFTERDFSIYVHGSWQVQQGITLHVGSSSVDIRHSLALQPSAVP